MNKDQLKGMKNELVGEVKEQVGKATDDKELQVRGHAREFAGKAQKKIGDIKEAAREDLVDLEAEREAQERRSRGG